MTSNAFLSFEVSFQRVRGLLHIGRALDGQPLAGLDLSETFRASVVMAVSALDAYAHNLCVEAIIAGYRGVRTRTRAYSEVSIRLLAAEVGVPSQSVGWLEGQLKDQFSRDTFQRPDDVAKALRFVDDRNSKWGRIGARVGLTAEAVKLQLGGIVDRRNMIVHEADLDPVYGAPRAISADEAEGAVDFIFRLVGAVDSECWQN
jgi:hypothetical protein